MTSAARVVDQVRGSVADDDRFHLSIVDRDGEELLTSSRSWTLPEITTRITELSGCTPSDALRRAARMGFTAPGAP